MSERTETVVADDPVHRGERDNDALAASDEARADDAARTDTGGSGDETESGERDLSLDHIFEILKNERRRYIFRYLESTEGPVSLNELAEQITAWENDKDVSQINSRERKRVYVGLYQCHLPKMDSMNVISFNKSRGVVEPSANIDLFTPYLQDEDPDERVWHRASAALADRWGRLVSWLRARL